MGARGQSEGRVEVLVREMVAQRLKESGEESGSEGLDVRDEEDGTQAGLLVLTEHLLTVCRFCVVCVRFGKPPCNGPVSAANRW